MDHIHRQAYAIGGYKCSCGFHSASSIERDRHIGQANGYPELGIYSIQQCEEDARIDALVAEHVDALEREQDEIAERVEQEREAAYEGRDA